jgi:hypothetical protein
MQELKFNDAPTYGPITRARPRLINYKNAAQLALLMLIEEGQANLCNGPCIACDSENDYFKLNSPQRKLNKKCAERDQFAKLFFIVSISAIK